MSFPKENNSSGTCTTPSAIMGTHSINSGEIITYAFAWRDARLLSVEERPVLSDTITSGGYVCPFWNRACTGRVERQELVHFVHQLHGEILWPALHCSAPGRRWPQALQLSPCKCAHPWGLKHELYSPRDLGWFAVLNVLAGRYLWVQR